jgi:hypothetical protein
MLDLFSCKLGNSRRAHCPAPLPSPAALTHIRQSRSYLRNTKQRRATQIESSLCSRHEVVTDRGGSFEEGRWLGDYGRWWHLAA